MVQRMAGWNPLETQVIASMKHNELDPAEPAKKETDATLEAIREADKSWLRAVQGRDPEKLASHYHKDATWLLQGEPTLTGIDAILGRWSKAYKDPGFHIEWEPRCALASDSQDLAVTVGHWSTSLKTEEGSTAKSQGNYLAVWRKHPEGGWRVLIDISN